MDVYSIPRICLTSKLWGYILESIMAGTLLKRELEKTLSRFGYVLQSVEEKEENLLLVGENYVGKVEDVELRMVVIKAVHGGVYRRSEEKKR
jgi:hypothetical protein